MKEYKPTKRVFGITLAILIVAAWGMANVGYSQMNLAPVDDINPHVEFNDEKAFYD